MKRKQSIKKEHRSKELEGDYITDMPVAKTEAPSEDPLNRFIEWPIIRPDGTRQPFQFRTAGHLISSGVHPENIQAASLIHTIMVSAALEHPISAMIVSDDRQEVVRVLDQCKKLIPKDATIEIQNLKPEHLYCKGGDLLDRKCIICPDVGGFKTVHRDLDLIIGRGHCARQEIVKGRFESSLAEFKARMKISIIGIDNGRTDKGLSHPSILKIPIRAGGIALDLPNSNLVEQFGLLQAPPFKVRKSLQRLKPRKVLIPFAAQLTQVMKESGCDYLREKMDVLLNMISICTIINQPPPVHPAELGAIMYDTDESEVKRWLIESGLQSPGQDAMAEPLVATKVDYHISRLLLDGMLLVGSTRFTDRQKMVFDAVKTLNMAKLSTALLSKGDDVEKLSTIAQGSGYWATREKIFEKIGRSDAQFSLSSMSNDLMALVTMGMLERAKPPKSRYYGYYITTPTLENAIGLPAPETIQDPIYEGKEVLVVNPLSGQVEKI